MSRRAKRCESCFALSETADRVMSKAADHAVFLLQLYAGRRNRNARRTASATRRERALPDVSAGNGEYAESPSEAGASLRARRVLPCGTALLPEICCSQDALEARTEGSNRFQNRTEAGCVIFAKAFPIDCRKYMPGEGRMTLIRGISGQRKQKTRTDDIWRPVAPAFRFRRHFPYAPSCTRSGFNGADRY